MRPLYVIKAGSATLDRGSFFTEIAALRARGARVLLVVGGALFIERYYDSLPRAVPMRRTVKGELFRYCPPEEMPFVIAAYERIALPTVEKGLAAHGLAAFTTVTNRGDLVSATANKPLRIVSATGRSVVVRDHRAGVPDTVQSDRLHALLDIHDVVALSPPVADAAGDGALNVDADVLAATLATALGADHLRLVTGTPGLLRELSDPSSTLPELYPGAGEQFALGRMRQKVRAAEMAMAGSADVAITGPHTLAEDSGWTRFWPQRPPADDLSLLSHAVTIPSVSRDEHELVRYLLQWCAARGIDAWRDEAGNLVAVKGNGARRLLLLGHLDTVPHHWPVRWKHDRILSGRGSVDAKGCLVNFLDVLAKVDVPVDGRLRVVGAVEEEISSAKGAFHVREHYPADAVIVGEPSGSDRLTVGYFGLFKLGLTVTVASGHSAGMGAISAPDRLIRALTDLRAAILALAPHALTTVIDVRSESGREANRAFGVLNVRVPPGVDLAGLEKIAHDHGDAGVSIDVLRATPGFAGGRATSLAKAFNRAFTAARIRPRFAVKKGTSDMNTLATTWHTVPMVAYGPGDSALDHTDIEHIDAEDYRRANAILADAVAAWFLITGERP
ncbi:M20/M25/M40 family metallo-hydrolase [Nocardia sp. NPDC127526]|uniref:M20/M25/M40 family metallo-hydrolase n=1 Tax=Nocardia sp. NPDC127526 TaxID=3345393 RepID=UPI00362ADDC7